LMLLERHTQTVGLTGSNERIDRRYDGLAPFYPLIDLMFLMPPAMRRRAVAALRLRSGQSVLEVGCGTGRNVLLLHDAVGTNGRITGIDISPGMLRRAEQLIERRNLSNVSVRRQSATELELDAPVDAVLFSLCYSVIPERQEALRRAWAGLRPGGRLTIMDGTSSGPLGRLVERPSRWISRLTVLGEPTIRPWQELSAYSSDVETHFFMGGTYVVCSAGKPTTGC
jgi:ubiquinone/menaquinone biosynthesis C-methylase UbiE